MEFYLFIYLWLRWVFIVAWGLSLVAVIGAALHRGLWVSPCSDSPCCQAGALACRLIICEHRLSCSGPCGIWTRDRTYIPSTGRWILNHRTTRRVSIFVYCLSSSSRVSSRGGKDYVQLVYQCVCTILWKVLGVSCYRVCRRCYLIEWMMILTCMEWFCSKWKKWSHIT